jgi:hypothetical protein
MSLMDSVTTSDITNTPTSTTTSVYSTDTLSPTSTIQLLPSNIHTPFVVIDDYFITAAAAVGLVFFIFITTCVITRKCRNKCYVVANQTDSQDVKITKIVSNGNGSPTVDNDNEGVPAVPPPPASCGTTIPYINKNHLTSELPVEQQESFGSHSDFTPANNNIDTVASPAYAIAVPGSVDSGGDYSWSNLKDGPLSEQLSQMSSRQQSYNSQMSSGQPSYNSQSVSNVIRTTVI